MLIYFQRVQEELAALHAEAEKLTQKFIAKCGPFELREDAESLRKRMEQVFAQLPDQRMSGKSGEHLDWVIRVLKKGDDQSCRSVWDSFASTDIPGTIDALNSWILRMGHLDSELSAAALPLVSSGQFDSAIRKAFVVLTERLRLTYSQSKSVDGEELINIVFGKAGGFNPSLDDGARQSYRNLFSGLYAVIRNKFAHGNDAASVADVEAALASVNLCLKIIKELKP